MKLLIWMCAGLLLTALGCKSVVELDRAEVANEGSVVFERASQLTMFFGTRSPRDYFEVVYEDFTQNEAGFPVMEIGIRYRGGTGFGNWSDKIPETLTLTAKTTFYKGVRVASPVAYQTTRQTLLFRKGETVAYKVVAPVHGAQSYQVVLGE